MRALLCVIAMLQQPVPGGQDAVFRASVQLVQLDVTVADRDGRFVAGLTPADFEVLQDGKPRPVRLVRPAGPGRSARDAAPVADDGAGPVRLVIVVDDAHMDLGSVARVREQLAAFADRALDGSLAVAVVGTSWKDDQIIDFSANAHDVKQQVGRLAYDPGWRARLITVSGGPVSCDALPAIEELGRNVYGTGPLATVSSVLAQLRERPGRKALLLLADNVDISTCRDRWTHHERLRRLGDLASRSSAVIYGVQTLPVSTGVSMPEHRATAAQVSGPISVAVPNGLIATDFRDLAEASGGFASRSIDLSGPLRAVLDDQRQYYLVAYEPPAGSFDSPAYREVSVRVRRPGVRVRTRAGFYGVADERLTIAP